MSINDATAAHPHIRFGIFELDLRASELRKKGARVKLQEQPCQILAMLLERPGEIVSREELRNRLWQRDTFVDFDHSLNTAIMRLREVLGDSSENPIFIETLSRRGYRFIAPVEEVAPLNGPTQKLQGLHSDSQFAAHDAGPAPTGIPQDERAAGRAPHYLQISTRAITATALLIAAFALVSVLIFRYARKPSVSSANSEPIKSLVVLPLEDLSAEKNQDYFADGMTDELIASLAKIRQLRVISRTSAMAYKGTRKPLSEIARDLHVDAVVEGTVLRAGNRVRITAELVQVSTDRHLWAETYESELGNILTLQSQVASAIVNEIRINLTPEEQKRLATPRMVNAQAYEDYLKGRYYWNKRSEEGLTKAVEYYQRAADKDPQYALAYAGLADCYDLLGSTIIGAMPSADAAPNAKAAALKALAIDPSLVDAEITLASIKLNYDWDWQGAENAFKHAIELNPEQATAHQRYSLYLTAMGRSQESLTEIKRAHELDPLSLSINFSLAWRLYLARQYDQAIQQSRSTIDLDPNFVLAHLVLGQTYQQKGEFELAISELKKAASISPDSPLMLGALGHAYAVAGNAADAEKLREDLIRRSSQQYVSPFYVALIFTGLKENEKALDWLDKAYQDRSNPLIFLKVDPELDPLRSSPRFQDLQRRIGLPR
jgi:TolB-like protein/DNA-binding winged helix-turn-helix (wHTH) protein/Tfp pilus assembly protein PilF